MIYVISIVLKSWFREGVITIASKDDSHVLSREVLRRNVRRVGNSSDANRLGPRRRSVGGSMGGRGAARSGQKSTRESTTAVKILVALNARKEIDQF